MYVVSVIPISRGAFKDTLSFFAKESIEPGFTVDVTIRGKKTPALVVESKDAREEKSALKSESYSLKKLTPKVKRRILPSSTIEALGILAEYHATPLGAVLAHFVPKAILDPDGPVEEASERPPLSDVASDVLALQADRDERIRSYRNTTREAFARGQSILIIAPTAAEAERLEADLSRGIEEQTLVLTSTLNKKKARLAWNRAVSEPEPLLIIATLTYITVPRTTISTVFVEREAAQSFVHHERPHLDVRIAAELIARKNGTRFVLADFPLRPETHARVNEKDIDEFARFQRSVRGGARIRIVDAREQETKMASAPKLKKKKFSPFTEHVLALIHGESSRGTRTFVYAARKGLAPLTVCNDCGTPITDPTTGAPMTLHQTDQGNMFISFRSGAVMPTNISCKTCGGWDLVSLGIGAQGVHQEIAQEIPNAPLFLFTAETANTHAKAKKLMKEFFDTPGAILVGTNKALPYLSESVDHTVVASLDSMLGSSAWRAGTRALATLYYLRDVTSDSVIVQTRLPDSPVMHAAATLNPNDFIQEELQERKQFGYPPYTTFISLTWTGTEAAVKKMSKTVAETLKDWELVGPLPPRALTRTRFIGRAVIRLEQDEWPDNKLHDSIRSLPREVVMTVDPDDIV